MSRGQYRPDTEVWSCPECTQTYRCPAGWETAPWLAARRAAQVIHASRHGRRDVLRLPAGAGAGLRVGDARLPQ